MTEKLLYPAGYLISITTWENDGDSYNTTHVSGLTEIQAQVIVAVCKLFKSRSRGGIGNMYSPRKSEIQEAGHKLLEVLSSFSQEVELNSDDSFTTAETIFSKLVGHDLYDLGITAGEYFTRVVEKVNVSFTESPIYIQDMNKELGV